MSILSIILSIVLTKESNLALTKEVEGSSFIVTLFYVLYLSLLANKFASTLTTSLYISSKVAEFLSLN